MNFESLLYKQTMNFESLLYNQTMNCESLRNSRQWTSNFCFIADYELWISALKADYELWISTLQADYELWISALKADYELWIFMRTTWIRLAYMHAHIFESKSS